MRVSKYLFHTLRASPADATLASHALMLRAGLIQKVSSGLYSYLPIGLRTFKKVEMIIREEMDKSGALETVMPIIIPEALLKKSGRWNDFKEELFRLQDRSGAHFALSPTNEENFTQTIKELFQSYKHFPINLYQIETKFRDEIRPRYGVMRGKQFTMKDAYSFHLSEASLNEGYTTMRETYKRIFTRMDFDFVHVEASSGAMGGSMSEEFIVKSQVGEETIMYCSNDSCHYAANIETATMMISPTPQRGEEKTMVVVDTPDADTISKVCTLLGEEPTLSIKTLVYEVQSTEDPKKFTPLIVIIRGDLTVNETKLESALDGRMIRLASETLIERIFGCRKGYIAPIALKKNVPVLVDISLRGMRDGIAGANEPDKHRIHVSLERDLAKPLIAAGQDAGMTLYREASLYQATEGAPCQHCQHPLAMIKGIEVGHIFALGDKYTRSFELSISNETGSSQIPLMGCYGIGVDRCLAAIIETHHDEHGIIFPLSIAPFHVMLIPISKHTNKDKTSTASVISPLEAACSQLYKTLTHMGIEVLWDDRKERPGVKFADADLLGIPFQIILSDKLLAQSSKPGGRCELKIRATAQREEIALREVPAYLQKHMNALTGTASVLPSSIK